MMTYKYYKLNAVQYYLADDVSICETCKIFYLSLYK